MCLVVTRCQYCWGPCKVRSNKQVWIGLQWWPPDVTSRGSRLEVPMSHVHGDGAGWMVLMSQVWRKRALGPGWGLSLVQLGPMRHGWWSHGDPLGTDWLTDTYDWKTLLTTPLVGNNNVLVASIWGWHHSDTTLISSCSTLEKHQTDQTFFVWSFSMGVCEIIFCNILFGKRELISKLWWHTFILNDIINERIVEKN